MTPELVSAVGEFALKAGLPVLVTVIIGAWGYQFFKNPPWKKP